ncbi:tetratricopeptide repeat protein [Xylanibacter muris]|uniref:Tetratricopeptide repeat protein n=1 Tax=Xylanibacter muris TaxID=2736290 RepID=A0ABX2ARC4_9BACT|nr:tetratricopeptide repeat protein [Xylanibacter muris]NPD92501.1 tetratricopeptide repeat protein [Xylanibacter muris]
MMKAVKYLFVIVSVFNLPLTVNAQQTKDPKAVVVAFKTVCKGFSAKEMDVFFQENLYRQHRQNPEVLTGVAEAFLRNTGVTDTLYSAKYAAEAMAVNPAYGPAYALMADIAYAKRDTLEVEKWLEKGMSAASNSPLCYIRYARLYGINKGNEAKMKEVMERLKSNVPDYPVYRDMARIYEERINRSIGSESYNLTEAVQNYEKEVQDSLAMEDASLFINHIYGTGVTQNSGGGKDAARATFRRVMDLCRFWLEKYPRSASFNRMGFYSAFNTDEWDEAISFADALFHRSDFADITADDVKFYAASYKGKKNYPKAVELYDEYLLRDNITVFQKAQVYGGQAECYIEMGDYDKAAQCYGTASETDADNKYAYLCQLAEMYKTKAEELNGKDKVDAYNTAVDIFMTVAEGSAKDDERALYACFIIINDMLKDKERVRPVLEKIISVFEAKGDKSIFGLEGKAQIYKMTALSYYEKKAYSKAYYYFESSLKCNPEDKDVANAVKVLKPYARRRR